MRHIPFLLLLLVVGGCTGLVQQQNAGAHRSFQQIDAGCREMVGIPPAYLDILEESEDSELLSAALGAPEAGKLCHGRVYRVKEGVAMTIYRTWNSTNSQGRLGNWWTFSRPEEGVAQYRQEYEICFQWSPLDKLTHCRVLPGTKIAVGSGQSAKCSEYLTYPTSPMLQIYLENASSSLSDCKDYDAIFHWKPVKK